MSFPHPDGTKPHILQDDEGETARFECPHDISVVATTHALTAGSWYAFNFITGQLVPLG